VAQGAGIPDHHFAALRLEALMILWTVAMAEATK
jgi:hypothetical protein